MVELEVVDATTWTLVRDVPITAITSVTDLAVHPSGAKIFVNTSDNDTYALDAASGAMIIHAGTSGGNLHHGLELSPDGMRFYSSVFFPSNSQTGVFSPDTVTFDDKDSIGWFDASFPGLLDYLALSPDGSEVALCLYANSVGWSLRLIHTAPQMGIDATVPEYATAGNAHLQSPVFTDDGRVLVYSANANFDSQTGFGQVAIYPFGVASQTALAPLIMSSYTLPQSCDHGCLAYDSVHKRAVAVGNNNDVVMVNTDGTGASFTAAPAGTATGMVKAMPGGTAYLIAHASSGTTTPTADTLYDASSPALPKLYSFNSTTKHVLAARFARISP